MTIPSNHIEKKDVNNGYIGIEFFRNESDGKDYVYIQRKNRAKKLFPLHEMIKKAFENIDGPMDNLLDQIVRILIQKGILLKKDIMDNHTEKALIDCIQKHFSSNKIPFDIVIKSGNVEVNPEK